MKIRTGFVSNSSSSSFVIKTEKSVDNIYADLYALLQNWITYRLFLQGNDKYINEYKKMYTLDNIKENVHIWKLDEVGFHPDMDLNIKCWYTEDHERDSSIFKNATVVYGEENYLPADNVEDFFWTRGMYNKDYEYIDSIGHMG